MVDYLGTGDWYIKRIMRFFDDSYWSGDEVGRGNFTLHIGEATRFTTAEAAEDCCKAVRTAVPSIRGMVIGNINDLTAEMRKLAEEPWTADKPRIQVLGEALERGDF